MDPRNFQEKLLTQPVPAWYDLAYAPTGALQIKVHRLALETITSVHFPLRQEVRRLQVKHRLPPFIFPEDQPWGFGPVLLIDDDPASSWATISCPLSTPYQPPTMAISATLQILFRSLKVAGLAEDVGQIKDHPPQLLLVNEWKLPLQRYPTSLVVTPPMRAWLSQQPTNQLQHFAQLALESARWYMTGNLTGRLKHFHCQDGVISFSPGNCQGLRPLSTPLEPSRGYILECDDCHSVVTQMELLMVLAGLSTALRTLTR